VAVRRRVLRRVFLPLLPLRDRERRLRWLRLLLRRCFLPLLPLRDLERRLRRLPLLPLLLLRDRDRDRLLLLLLLLRRRFLHRLPRASGSTDLRVADGLRHFLDRWRAWRDLEDGEPLMMFFTKAAAYFLPLYITILPLEPELAECERDLLRLERRDAERDLDLEPAMVWGGGAWGWLLALVLTIVWLT